MKKIQVIIKNVFSKNSSGQNRLREAYLKKIEEAYQKYIKCRNIIEESDSIY
jgi:uncharacterized protein YnzC (UPF0291/DUF896 family)